MRIILRLSAVVVLVLAGWAVPPLLVQAAFLDTTADRVFGQADFPYNTANSAHQRLISRPFALWVLGAYSNGVYRTA